MMKIRRLFYAVAATTMLFASCVSTDHIAYISDANRDVPAVLQGEFSKGIQCNDLLSIYVESETPATTIRFNQETNKIAVDDGTVMNPGSAAVTGYLVNQAGDITFPVLGKIHVLGLSHDRLAALIEDRLRDEGHIKDPIVTVKLMNFKVCVLGEVSRPGQLTIDGERATIFEALSRVGDMTIYGQRKNVTVIREENGVRVIGNIDLTSEKAFESPYYYLHQNDVIYVEPSLKKKKNAERDPMTLNYVSSAVSIISVAASVFYYYVLTKYYMNR